MQVSEAPVSMRCDSDTLRGVLALPLEGACDTAVVFVVGGPQYRVGSHRQFVHLARSLAEAGFATLRFDVRGMGDSDGARRSFEDIGPDIQAAVAATRQHTGAQRVVLWGLCDGASAALLYLHATQDPQVAGLILANPWVRTEEGLAKTQLRHYYGRRLLSSHFWSEFFRGRVAGQAARDLLRNLRLALLGSPGPRSASGAVPDYRERMARAWQGFNGPILLVLSENDYTAKEFLVHTAEQRSWQGALSCPKVRRFDAIGADHTFSSEASRAAVAKACIDWLDSDALLRKTPGSPS